MYNISVMLVMYSHVVVVVPGMRPPMGGHMQMMPGPPHMMRPHRPMMMPVRPGMMRPDR